MDVGGSTSEGRRCGRARFWASLSLDGELSELEAALLDAHLAGCPGCRAAARDFAAATAALRGARLRAAPPIRVSRAAASA